MVTTTGNRAPRSIAATTPSGRGSPSRTSRRAPPWCESACSTLSASARTSRPSADAAPSHVCGLRSQHQPSFARRSLIHTAGTRWLVPVRDASSEKHLLGEHVRPDDDERDPLVDGQRGAPASGDRGQRVLRPDVAELRAGVDAPQQVRLRRDHDAAIGR